MKKTILFLALIVAIFTACEQQPKGIAKENVYGTWVCENNGFLDTSNPDAKQEDLLFLINEKNATFISEDSIAIRHGYWGYTEDSDLGYITYRYELTEEKKLILTTHNKVSGKDSFFEFTKRPDLDPVVEYFIADEAIDRGGLIDAKEFLGKWEWVATENLDSSNTVFAKHVMDTLENAVFEFVPNTAILFYDGSIVNNNRRMSLYSMPPYRVIMSNKEKGIIADWAVAEFANGLHQMLFRFPRYNKNNELMGYYHFGGSHYFYSSLEKGKIVLSDRYSDTKITFKRIE